jgi:ubiquinone/menaquinone biosynthesis C-methylase UbiE
MTHEDHVYLLRGGVPNRGGVWADLGSGTGAFTLALADLIGPEGEIYSVDTDRRALQEQERIMGARFPTTTVHYIAADFTRPIELPPLTGVVMANSLHYQRNKDSVLRLVRGYLQPGGRLILVEYNTDRGNPWVPHPLSYATWETLARRSGFANTWLLATVPSRFLGEIYSALSVSQEQ